METNLTIVDPKEFGLEEQKGKTIESAFTPKLIERDAFSEQYSAIIASELNDDTFKAARELRLKLVKVRTGIADIHKTEKAFYLASGKFVDALKNKLTLPIEQMEEKLKEIEEYEAKQEAERKAKLKAERILAFEPYGTDTSFLPLAEMTEEQFQGQLAKEKLAYETKLEQERKAEQERLEAEKKAEAERVEAARIEAERIEAQRVENERLKKEAEQREKELEAERKKLAAEQAKKDAEAKAEKERLEKIAAEEKAKADKLAAEIKAKEEAEKLAQEKEKQRIEDETAEKEAAEKAKRLAPDKEKINALFLAIKGFEFPDCESEEANQIITEVKQGFELILNGIKTAAKTLK